MPSKHPLTMIDMKTLAGLCKLKEIALYFVVNFFN